MLWSMAFERVGVVIGDLYFVDPSIDQGEAGAERGVRLELRFFEREPLRGSPYSAVPIRVERPIWRVDLLETAESEPGSLNRAHHHPKFEGWDPSSRAFVPELSEEPLRWVRDRLDDIDAVLDDAGVADEVHEVDRAAIRRAAPAITTQLEWMLAEVAGGRAGHPPTERGDFVRSGWL